MTTITTLKSGIIIRDARTLGCGVRIENQNTKWVSLCYGKHGFYISTVGTWIDKDSLQAYCKEVEMMAEAMKEANELFKLD